MMKIKFKSLDELYDFLLKIKLKDGHNIISGKIIKTTDGINETKSISFNARLEK